MQRKDLSGGRRVRRRFAMGGGALAVALAAVVALALPASADTVSITLGQGGTNADGSCANFQAPASGTQTWHFNLTGTEAGATLTASFSDGTTVTDEPEDQHQGNTSFWFIVTDAGAKLISATATFTPAPTGEHNLVVSDCVAGGEKPPTPTTTTTTTPGEVTTPTTAAKPPAPSAPAAPAAGAPAAVAAAPRVTG
jgi:hypothetical protein